MNKHHRRILIHAVIMVIAFMAFFTGFGIWTAVDDQTTAIALQILFIGIPGAVLSINGIALWEYILERKESQKYDNQRPQD